ncbi:GH10580 [Drosophila grimshawi]|uniref:GH10580 n=2 Tax=Drosophila grimshawi TaxID=7222 RepID=B4JDB2_DROGR|nr:GH10580 [Drosophila grimshawi]
MSSYRTLMDRGTSTTSSNCSTLHRDSAPDAAASPTALHRMLKYWRNSSGKIPGLRKSESFADYRRHSAGGAQTHATLPGGRQVVQYQRLKSCDEGNLAQMR